MRTNHACRGAAILFAGLLAVAPLSAVAADAGLSVQQPTARPARTPPEGIHRETTNSGAIHL